MSGAKKNQRVLPIALGLAVLLAVGGLIVLLRHYLSSAPAPQKKVVQEIHVIRPPPPPPDVPPPPPPPPEEEVKLKEPQPEPTPSNEPPPGEQLGLDANGAAGSDGFGLAARPGGRDLLATGGSALAWYGGQLKNAILDCLQDDKEARKGSYSALLRVWLKPNGVVERASIAESSGDTARDRAIERSSRCIDRKALAPPADMPQPLSLRIVSRA